MSDVLIERFKTTRHQSVLYCEPLNIEDYGLQAEAFTSPPKWHLAHTSWFFETFLLKPFYKNYQTPNEQYEVLFNSYYNGVGEQFLRRKRGLLTRPTVEEVIDYRNHVNDAMEKLLKDEKHPEREMIQQFCRLGIEHEQQHQELFFTDIKYSLAENPLRPTFSSPTRLKRKPSSLIPLTWREMEGGVIEFGYNGNDFCFDNELPRHKFYLEPFLLANRLTTNGEYQQFIEDGGYHRPEFWLADGWNTLQTLGWQGPQYWCEKESKPMEYTLHGLLPREDTNPVCHISGYEADAFARWSEARLLTEQEWEHAAGASPVSTAGVDDGIFHPQSAMASEGLLQLYGDCWQWTQSAYSPYPGYNPAPGAIGEYNSKFMSSQWVLRGGSCVSKSEHLRSSYRNFFYPQDRWQFTGIRLAKSYK